MKKDLDKILSRTLLTYTFLLFVVLILKIAGFDYFGLDINNPVILSIDKLINKYNLNKIVALLFFYFNTYIIISITCNCNNKKIKLVPIVIIIYYIIRYFLSSLIHNNLFGSIFDTLFLCVAIIIINNFLTDKKLSLKKLIKNYIIFAFINIIFQIISSFTRSINIIENTNFITSILLNLDYVLLLVILYKLYFMRGDSELWATNLVGGFSGLLILLKTQLKEFPTKFLKTKNKIKSYSSKERFETSLYLFLFLLWNIFQVFVVLFVAKLNNGLPECIFIILAFWMNKKVFGKAFHMKSASSCFITSNLVYYVLVRICISINISLLFPIILGVLLSYFTSLLVKYNEFKLYRGMPKDDLIAHCKICNLNKYDTQLMIDYYCERKTDVQIAMKNNYSVEAIKKQKKKVRDILNNH